MNNCGRTLIRLSRQKKRLTARARQEIRLVAPTSVCICARLKSEIGIINLIEQGAKMCVDCLAIYIYVHINVDRCWKWKKIRGFLDADKI